MKHLAETTKYLKHLHQIARHLVEEDTADPDTGEVEKTVDEGGMGGTEEQVVSFQLGGHEEEGGGLLPAEMVHQVQ